MFCYCCYYWNNKSTPLGEEKKLYILFLFIDSRWIVMIMWWLWTIDGIIIICIVRMMISLPQCLLMRTNPFLSADECVFEKIKTNETRGYKEFCKRQKTNCASHCTYWHPFSAKTNSFVLLSLLKLNFPLHFRKISTAAFEVESGQTEEKQTGRET